MTIPESARGSTRKCPSCDRAVTAPVDDNDKPQPSSGDLSFWAIAGMATAAVIAAVVFIHVGMFRSTPRESRSAEPKAETPVAVTKKSVDVVDKQPEMALAQPGQPEVVEKTRPPMSQGVAQRIVAPVSKRKTPVVKRVQESKTSIDWPALKPFNVNARWSVPKLNDANFQKWINRVRPTKDDLKWRKIRWHKSLSVAAAEAKKLQRPILLWTMNGHPCGET